MTPLMLMDTERGKSVQYSCYSGRILETELSMRAIFGWFAGCPHRSKNKQPSSCSVLGLNACTTIKACLKCSIKSDFFASASDAFDSDEDYD